MAKTLTCRKCGHKVGSVTIKPKLNRRLIAYAFLIAFGLQLASDLLLRVIGL